MGRADFAKAAVVSSNLKVYDIAVDFTRWNIPCRTMGPRCSNGNSGRCGSSIRGRRRWWVRSDGCRVSTQGVLMNATRSCRRTAVGSAGWLTIPMRNPLHRPLSSSSHPGAAMPHMLVGTCAAPVASRRTPRSPTAALPAVPTLWPESCHRGHTDGNPSRHGMYPKECRLQAAARRWRLTMSA